ncbi:Unknown protein sequence [Pseudomonas amygdali pv. lachrymans]|nr:Unknown protein sequence [Pseudomonas amygdali pv. lachrymans]
MDKVCTSSFAVSMGIVTAPTSSLKTSISPASLVVVPAPAAVW